MRARIPIRLPLILSVSILSVTIMLAVAAYAQEKSAAAAQATSPEIQAVLERMIHVKKAKVGDTVSARVTIGAKLKDGTEITKGSHLIGKVTEVKSKSDVEGPARLGMLFNQAQLKDGKQVEVAMVLMSVAPPWQPGGVDVAAADNKMSGAQRTQNMNGDSTPADPTSAQSSLARGGLGIRAANTNRDPSALQPGVSYLEDIVLKSYAMGEPGTVLESKKGAFYIDSGCRLLFMGQ